MGSVKHLLYFTFFVSVCSDAFEITTIKKVWSKSFQFKLPSIVNKDNLIPYANCVSFNDTLKSASECVFVQEDIISNDVTQKDSCFVRFGTKTKLASVEKLAAVDKNRFYIVFLEEGNSKLSVKMSIRILNMLNCEYKDTKPLIISLEKHPPTETSLIFRLWITNVFPYEDGTIDVFSWFFESCERSLCKATYDANGEILTRPVPILNNEDYLYQIYPTKYSTSPKNYYVLVDRVTIPSIMALMNLFNFDSVSQEKGQKNLGLNRITVHLSQVRDDGKESELASLKEGLTFHFNRGEPKLIDADDSHGVFGMCWSSSYVSNNSTVKCTQYDLNKNKILDASLNLTYSPTMVKILNSAKGGLLLLMGEGKNRTAETADPYENLYLKHIDSTGRMGHAFEITGLTCPDIMDQKKMRVSLNEGEDLCISVICDIFSKTGETLTRKCIPKKLVYKQE